MHTERGEFTDLSSGHAGRYCGCSVFDALLRSKSCGLTSEITFSEGFYFDSIHSTAWIKDGVLHTDDTLVDGLEADIAMKGSVDLVRRRLDMEAVVAPEISATVGVAAAFAVNPIVGGGTLFSKVLGPLWAGLHCDIALPVGRCALESAKFCASREKYASVYGGGEVPHSVNSRVPDGASNFYPVLYNLT